MTSEVKSIMSTDIYDLKNYRPDDHKNFRFVLTVMVGPAGGAGEEMFNVEVCTPQWLQENNSEEEVISGRHKFIVFKPDMENILRRINKTFNNCVGKDWNEIATRLARYGHWEFEDYRP